MSQIDELIAELCPQGVRLFALGDVIKNLRTGLNPRQNFKLNTPAATHKYITVRELAGFTIRPTEKTDLIDDDGLMRIQARSRLRAGDVLFSGTGTIGRTALVDEEPRTWNIKEGVYAITPNEKMINSKFLIYLLHSSAIRSSILASSAGSTVTSVSMAMLRKVSIPVPPLEVQRAIVEILDKFTELEAELETELEARKKQYEHYRSQILSADKSARWIALDEVCHSISAGGDRPDDTAKGQKSPTKEHPYPVYSNGSEEKALYGFTDSYKISEKSVTISARGTIGYHAVRSPKFTPIVRLLVLIPNTELISAEFLNYILDITPISHSGGSIPQLTVPALKLIKIPLPDLQSQHKIVDALEKFDALVNDLSSGLPAEIAARRRQYEYYRDQLLTFKELAS